MRDIAFLESILIDLFKIGNHLVQGDVMRASYFLGRTTSEVQAEIDLWKEEDEVTEESEEEEEDDDIHITKEEWKRAVKKVIDERMKNGC